jgi:ankyrin repeat protein
MDRRLLKAATSGDSKSLKELAAENPSMLRGTTPQRNTCLHISSVHGHEEFCKDVLALNHSLLSKVNVDKETPLIVAVTGGHVDLASLLLTCCHELGLSETILEKDKNKCNALHHAIHCGHRNLALELIRAEPALSQGVNEYDESPLFVAVMRDFTDVSEELLAIPDSAYSGPHSYNALHAAVRNGNSGKT